MPDEVKLLERVHLDEVQVIKVFKSWKNVNQVILWWKPRIIVSKFCFGSNLYIRCYWCMLKFTDINHKRKESTITQWIGEVTYMLVYHAYDIPLGEPPLSAVKRFDSG